MARFEIATCAISGPVGTFASVDPRVEADILAALRRSATPVGTLAGAASARAGAVASILVVAYRRATISLADVVVYVEAGRVVATGTHDQLLKTVPGYAALVTAYEDADRESVS